MTRRLPLGIALVVVAGASAAASYETQRPATASTPASSNIRQREQCQVVENIFYRLAEQRKAGAGREYAVSRVQQWLAEAGTTGSHLSKNYTQPVSEAAALVFKQSTLSPPALGYFGFNSCQLGFEFEGDEWKKTASVVLLLKATTECQAKFPGDVYNNALGDCIKNQRTAIADKVRVARIETR